MESYSIGRDEMSNVIVYDPTKMVSRRHATLTVNGRKMTITDHSTNGTYINGIRIASNTPVPVTRDDVVNFAQAADLNWSSIPSKSGRYGMVAAIIAFVLVVGGVSFYFLSNRSNKPKQVVVQQQDSLNVAKMAAAIDALEKDIDGLSATHSKVALLLDEVQKQCDAKPDSKKLREAINICHDAENLFKNLKISEYKDKISRLKENLSDGVKDTQNRIDELKKTLEVAKGNLDEAEKLLNNAEKIVKALPDKAKGNTKKTDNVQKKDTVQTVMNPNPIIY